jgi:hypothetical protein
VIRRQLLMVCFVMIILMIIVVIVMIVVMIMMIVVMMFVMVVVMSKLIVNLLAECSLFSFADFPQGRALCPISFF